eukprot:TRINITY_DN37186_c0_g2_i1.p2 TRINITY_DN37186_c0_g2~~TRINITY_DN37186_c0_g2_i1.p2  ORF type:complete len:143 (-),score=2.53 TRINITY_DN37186_c0_g2_i1:150-533(-)
MMLTRQQKQKYRPIEKDALGAPIQIQNQQVLKQIAAINRQNIVTNFESHPSQKLTQKNILMLLTTIQKHKIHIKRINDPQFSAFSANLQKDGSIKQPSLEQLEEKTPKESQKILSAMNYLQRLSILM